MSRGDRPGSEHERTPEERERDRAERERRRALRTGLPPAQTAAGRKAGTEARSVDPVEPDAELLLDPAAEPVPEEAHGPLFDPAPEPMRGEAAEPVPEEAPVAERLASRAPSVAPAPRGARGLPRRGRSGAARAGAVLALAIVVAAIVLGARAIVRSRHSSPPPAPAVIKLLIPEGDTRAQIAEIAAADGLSGSYRRASVRSPLLDPSRYGAPRDTPDLEGFLFPATYDVTRGEPAVRLVQEQLIAFREHFGGAEVRRARALHVTPYGLLTVASMVEREAKVPGDRAKIAAVIYNRLRLGMPLGIDATIYYALEQRRHLATLTGELTEADLHIDSPYNTRTHTGLPPTPISNPGAASIAAAAHPAHVSYLYYVASPDGCGGHVFTSSLAAFERAADAYRAAVARNSGRPPVCGQTR